MKRVTVPVDLPSEFVDHIYTKWSESGSTSGFDDYLNTATIIAIKKQLKKDKKRAEHVQEKE